MLVGALVVALLLGLVAGGSIVNLGRIRLRWAALLFVAVVLRYGTEAAIRYNVPPAATFRLPLYGLAFGILAAVLWANRTRPGLLVASAGIAANGLAIVMNGGWMPVWQPAMQLVGMPNSDLVVAFHRVLPEQLGVDFLLRAGPFGDLIPVPLPLITNVASMGDLFIATGLAWFVFASLVAPADQGTAWERQTATVGGATAPSTAPSNGPVGAIGPAAAAGAFGAGAGVAGPVGAIGPAAAGPGAIVWPTPEAASVAAREIAAARAAAMMPPVMWEPGRARGSILTPRSGIGEESVLRRPVLLGGTPSGLTMPQSSVAGETMPQMAAVASAYPAYAPTLPVRRPLAARIAGHPYVRLALDARFSAMWLGQLISLLGDRLHQVALAVLVLSLTGSALQVGLTFLSATLPNLLFGPLAGTLVDRWDQKRVLIVSDLLRAGLVLLVPVAAQRDILFVYPVVFAITTVSIFFRPARTAILPRIVDQDDLTAANAATWTAETFADIAGYAFAGVFVAFLGASLWIAFWFDSVSYLASAALVASITIPAVMRTVAPVAGNALRRFQGELAAGWRFLEHEPALFQNTLISAVAQLSVGATIALTVVYARDVLQGTLIPYPQSYAAVDVAIGLGNLVGGLVIGAIGARWRKGLLVIVGYVVMGLATVVLGSTGNELLALPCAWVIGVANMIFMIPTQTMFAQRTPPDLMGRVVGIRFSIVFGALTAAMAVSGVMAEALGAGGVFMVFGAITALAGAAGVLLPAVRDA